MDDLTIKKVSLRSGSRELTVFPRQKEEERTAQLLETTCKCWRPSLLWTASSGGHWIKANLTGTQNMRNECRITLVKYLEFP